MTSEATSWPWGKSGCWYWSYSKCWLLGDISCPPVATCLVRYMSWLFCLQCYNCSCVSQGELGDVSGLFYFGCSWRPQDLKTHSAVNSQGFFCLLAPKIGMKEVANLETWKVRQKSPKKVLFSLIEQPRKGKPNKVEG